MAAQSDHVDTAKLLLKRGSPPDDVTMVSHKLESLKGATLIQLQAQSLPIDIQTNSI